MKTTFLLFIMLTVNILKAQTFDWVNQIGGNNFEQAGSISTDASGNVYTTGSFSGTVDFDPGPSVQNLTSIGGSDVFISMSDASGNLIWVKQIGGGQRVIAKSIALDASKNIYVTGAFRDSADFDPGPGNFYMQAVRVTPILGPGPPPPINFTYEDIFILKLDANGNFTWAKRIGGSGGDFGKDISVDGNGNVYTVGSFTDFRYRYANSDTVDFDPGPGVFNLSPGGAFILKLDASGNFVWAKHLGRQNSLFVIFWTDPQGNWTGFILEKTYTVEINALDADASGNLFTTGTFNYSADFDPGPGTTTLTSGYTAAFVSKLDVNGNFVWAKPLGGNSAAAVGQDLKVDDAGNIVSTGYFAGDFDANPGAGSAYLNTVITGGYSQWNLPLHDVDVYVSKLDAAGNYLWGKQMGGLSDDRPNSLALDANGNIYTTGSFSFKADFDPGPNRFKLSAFGNGNDFNTDVFISKLDASGNFVWAGQLGGVLDDQGVSITVDHSNSIYTTGSFFSTADFDPGSGIFNLNSVGYADIFIHKLNQPNNLRTAWLEENNIVQANIHAYPNPTNGLVTVFYKQVLENANIRVFNSVGQLLHEEKNYNGTDFSINLADQNSGIYFIEINDGVNLSRIKVVKSE